MLNIVIDIKQQDKKVQAMISGEIDAYTAPKLREELLPCADQEGIEMTVNLSGVSYMDSTGLGVFVGLFKKLNETDGKLALTGLQDRLKRLFDITGLSEMIDINTGIKGGV